MIYLICGYGIPDNIQTDRNYIGYLDLAFNHIYEHSKGKEAVLIPCGGPTDCEPPYERTEAGEMAKALRELMSREVMGDATKKWKLLLEDKSLSTLENLIFAKRTVDEHRLEGPIVVFGAWIGKERRQTIADAVFGQGRSDLVSIDFDISQNRYLDPELLAQKETRALEEALWTLKDPSRLAKHHEAFEKKFVFLRKRQEEGVSHADAIKEWYEKAPEILRELMSGHPLFGEGEGKG